jgi:hypothetical protein
VKLVYDMAVQVYKVSADTGWLLISVCTSFIGLDAEPQQCGVVCMRADLDLLHTVLQVDIGIMDKVRERIEKW